MKQDEKFVALANELKQEMIDYGFNKGKGWIFFSTANEGPFDECMDFNRVVSDVEVLHSYIGHMKNVITIFDEKIQKGREDLVLLKKDTKNLLKGKEEEYPELIQGRKTNLYRVSK